MESIPKQSDGHVLEVPKSNANQWMKALDLCNSRILGDGHDSPFDARPARLEVEIHFFLVALLRFSRSIALAASKLPHSGELKERIRDFHTYIGIKRTMRNVGEHFDEYLQGRGRDSTVDQCGLQVWEMDLQSGNVRFTWLGETFDLKRTMQEACELWSTFLSVYKPSRPAQPHNAGKEYTRYAGRIEGVVTGKEPLMSFKINRQGMRKLQDRIHEVTKDFEREVNEIASKHAGEGEASLLRLFREAARKRGIEPDETFFRNLARRVSSEARQSES